VNLFYHNNKLRFQILFDIRGGRYISDMIKGYGYNSGISIQYKLYMKTLSLHFLFVSVGFCSYIPVITSNDTNSNILK